MPRSNREQVRLGAKRQITLPRAATSRLRLREGDVLELRLREDGIELVPMALIPRNQLWYWTPEWQAKEREADEDIRKGRVKKHRGASATIKALKS